jgi:predicted O-linked N-acetylglucosamine transferase (SPINDLY family)
MQVTSSSAKTTPNEEELDYGLVQSLLKQADSLFTSNDKTQCLEVLFKVRELPLTEEFLIGSNIDFIIGALAMDTNNFYCAYNAFKRCFDLNFSNRKIEQKIDLLNYLANTCCICGRIDEAYFYCKQLVTLKPNIESYFYLLYLMNHTETFSDKEINNTAKEIYDKFFKEDLAKEKALISNLVKDTKIIKGEIIKIGVLTPHLMANTAEYILAQSFLHIDKKKYELHWFHTEPNADEMTIEIIRQSKSYINLKGKDRFSIAKTIANKGIHILVDTLGIIQGNLLDVFTLKPAPVQISTFGYWGSSGLPQMDYLIHNTAVVSKDSQESMYEKIINIENQYYLPDKFTVEVLAPPCLKNNYTTFGCFNRSPKINSKVLAVWSLILNLTPSSRLILSNKALFDNAFKEYIWKIFEANGISRERVTLIHKVDSFSYFNLYNDIDIALDPFPFNGSCTTVDTLWMGTPLIVLTGPRTTLKMSPFFINKCEIPELIAHNEQEYIMKAVQLAKDFNRIEEYKKSLRKRLITSKINDAEAAGKDFEKALDTIIELELEK